MSVPSCSWASSHVQKHEHKRNTPHHTVTHCHTLPRRFQNKPIPEHVQRAHKPAQVDTSDAGRSAAATQTHEKTDQIYSRITGDSVSCAREHTQLHSCYAALALTEVLQDCPVSMGCCRRIGCCSSTAPCRTHEHPSRHTTAPDAAADPSQPPATHLALHQSNQI
jgi:hypothetical protein